jgi:hypothetical protein
VEQAQSTEKKSIGDWGELNDDLQSIKEVIKEGSGSKGKRMANKLEKAYLALLLFMPIFSSQLEDLGEGMGLKNISTSLLQGQQDWHLSSYRTLTRPPLADKDKKKMSHQKNSGQCKIIMDRHSNYSPTSNEGCAIILILVLEDLHRTTI